MAAAQRCVVVEDTAEGPQLRLPPGHPVWHARGLQRAVNVMSGLARDHAELPPLMRIYPYLPHSHVISLATLSQMDTAFLREHLLVVADAHACTMDETVRAYTEQHRPCPPRENPRITTSRLREDPPDITTDPPLLLSRLLRRRHSEPLLGTQPRP